MDELVLRSLSGDVESNVEIPDFEAVEARGHQIRRRRNVAAGLCTALVVLVVAVGVVRFSGVTRPAQPIHQPTPRLHEHGGAKVLGRPDAQVDVDASRVDGEGDMLAVVVTPGARATTDPTGCPARVALRWTGGDGGLRSWLDRLRTIEPLRQGFVVAEVPAECRSGAAVEGDAYLVDGSGRARPIAWTGDSEPLCSAHPEDPRCMFDLDTATARLSGPVQMPPEALAIHSLQGETLWARSPDARTLFWSQDGEHWSSRTTRLPAGGIVSASAAGSWGVLAGTTFVEFTSDGGATWHTRDLTAALRPIRIGEVDWTVTRTGRLLGVTQLVGRGDVLFRSTDASWTKFVETYVRTSFGLVRPTVEGSAVYVVDDERWAISTNDGKTWRRTPPLPN